MKVVLDMNLSTKLAPWLCERGVDAKMRLTKDKTALTYNDFLTHTALLPLALTNVESTVSP